MKLKNSWQCPRSSCTHPLCLVWPVASNNCTSRHSTCGRKQHLRQKNHIYIIKLLHRFHCKPMAVKFSKSQIAVWPCKWYSFLLKLTTNLLAPLRVHKSSWNCNSTSCVLGPTREIYLGIPRVCLSAHATHCRE